MQGKKICTVWWTAYRKISLSRYHFVLVLQLKIESALEKLLDHEEPVKDKRKLEKTQGRIKGQILG